MKTIFNNRVIPEMEERHIVGSASVGKWWSRTFNTALTFHFDQVNVAEEFRQYMRSGNTKEYNYGLELMVRYDTRDLFSYPTTGWLTITQLYKYGFFTDYNDYENIIIDLRRYFHIGPIILAGRFYQNSLFGEIPIYRVNFIGFSERIRGYFYEEWAGKHVQIGSIETRFNIIPISYFSLDLPGIPPQYLQNLQIGLSAALFIDTGIVWESQDQYTKDNFRTGFGFGIHIHLPYIEIFRVDIGFDGNLDSQVIVEMGVVF
jgi:outer membrane protein assembly factor BamA